MFVIFTNSGSLVWFWHYPKINFWKHLLPLWKRIGWDNWITRITGPNRWKLSGWNTFHHRFQGTSNCWQFRFACPRKGCQKQWYRRKLRAPHRLYRRIRNVLRLQNTPRGCKHWYRPDTHSRQGNPGQLLRCRDCSGTDEGVLWIAPEDTG